jgi:hypothetical protein
MTNRPLTSRARFWLCGCIYLSASYPAISYPDFTGRYVAEDDPSIALMISENPDGSAALTLVLAFGGETVTHRFHRTGEAAGEEAARAVRPSVPAVGTVTPIERDVVVNNRRLTDAELATIEQSYRVHIEDAAYWYDASSGAWGIEGGPTRGFIYSGLKLGGPLNAGASGGGTNVFVNGRELHPLDVNGLRRCMQVDTGRYWVGADGVGGYEGGPPLFNLMSLCGANAHGDRPGGWLCDGGSCARSRTVTGPYAVTSEGDGNAGVYTDQGLILTPN